MKKLMFAVIGAMLTGSLFASYAFTYQAALRDEKGAVITQDGKAALSHTVTIRLWDGPAGGVLLWGRTFNVLTDNEGVFNLEVSDETGSKLTDETTKCSSLDQVFTSNQAGDVYIGLDVAGSAGEIVPRQRLFAVPFAAVANDVRAISKDVTVGGNIKMGSGNVLITSTGITQSSGTSTFKTLIVEGPITSSGTITAKNGITVNGGTLTVKTNIAVDSGKKITIGGADIVPVPVGGIIMWTKSTLPDNEHWAICNGQKVGTITTPDLRDRFIVGAGSSTYPLGRTGGEMFHTLTMAEMPRHSHSIEFHTYDIDDSWKDQNNLLTTGKGPVRYTDSTGPAGGNPNGTTASHENRPPFYALYYIMRVK